MKKTLFVIILIFLMIGIVYAVDQKLTALTELTAVADTDIIYIVDDPGGSPLSRKITILNLFDTIDTFSELNTIVTDKTLVNEEDAATWDALGTFSLGVTITTGDPFTLGTNRIDNGSDLLDGEMIAADTIDNDSIDWGDMTDLTTDGAVVWGNIAEGELADSTVVTGDIKDGTIALGDLAAAAYAKDLVTTAPITGAADNIFVGADSDVTVALTLLKDIVTTAPITGGEDDVLPGADADLTIAITLAKDLVTTSPLTGGTDNIFPGSDSDITVAIPVATTDANGYLCQTDWDTFNNKMASTLLKDLVTTAPITGGTDDIFPGADADITVALDFTAAWDFSGATTIIPWKVNATAAPTVEGQAIWESDTDELTVGDGSVSIVIGAKTNTVFCFNIHDIDTGMDDIKMPFTRAVVITKVTAFVTGGTNVVGRLYEVDGDGDDADAVGVESSDWTFTAGETEDTSFNNATFDAGDYIQWDTTSVSGSVTGFMISVEGYEI